MANWKHTIHMQPEFGAAQLEEHEEGRGTIKAVIAKFKAELAKLPEHVRTSFDDYIGSELDDLVEMAGDDDVDADEFDEVWNQIYDWANARRIWIETIL